MSHGKNDAHGHGDDHGHGHTIVPQITLRLVLAALLFFTFLTVGVSLGEKWLADIFHVEIPQLINVFVALSIATVKTLMVVMYFMQLRYDNPLNTMVLIFTVITVAFFLGFTTLDLGNRETLSRVKATYRVDGGMGPQRDNVPITRRAREAAEHNYPEKVKPLYGHEPKGGFTEAGYRPRIPERGSSSNVSRPIERLTLPGFASDDGKDDHHGGH